MKKNILTVILLVSSVCISFGQVVINEISASNVAGVSDNDGDYSDWIELYNSGNQSVDLTNYVLTDDPFVPKWTFPAVSIAPDEHLLVFASGKDKIDKIDHWESPVLESDIWSYIVPDALTPQGWNSVAFNDATWSTGIGGIGYGDGDDGTEITGPVISVFMRSTFQVLDVDQVKDAIFHIDYDDGYVAYLNGVEISRANMLATDYDDLAEGLHEAEMYSGGSPDEVIIDNDLLKSALVTGTNVLAIQVHNNVSTSSDLTARAWLSFGMGTPVLQWSPIPTFFTPPSTGVFIHTNFSLNNGKEGVVLFNSLGVPIDGISPPEVIADVTYGRQIDGGATFKYFLPGTPDSTNSGSTPFDGIWIDTVFFSLPAGFYSGTQSLSLSAGNPLSTIKYTLDGSKPSASSTNYTGAININQTMVVRAIAVRSGYISENRETNTYLIGSQDNPQLPVMSISTDPDGFFDFNTGIYELGPNASGVQPNHGANFWEDWEREMHFEYFDESDQQQIEQDCGVKIFGGWSRDQDMRSLRLIGRDKYGDKSFSHKFFKDKNIDSFRQLVLRNSGNEFNITHFRDGLNHTVIKDVGNHDRMAYQPVVVFINGDYWGIHNLRERMNSKYVEDNHGIDDDDINVIENNGAGEEVVKNGDNIDWLASRDFAINSDLTIQSNYDIVKSNFDIPNVIDYVVSQTYHINWDAPHNNVRAWRAKDLSTGWRYLYYDTDFGLGLFGHTTTQASYNDLDRWLEDTRSQHSALFKALLTNDEYKCQFVNRYADLMNTVYEEGNYKAAVDSIKTLLSADMPEHWGKYGSSSSSWDWEIDRVKTFIEDRKAYAVDDIIGSPHISGVSSTKTLTVDVLPAGSGKVLVNTVTPKQYPWTGDYFNGCPVEITAVPEPGFQFDNWTGSNSSSNQVVSLSFGSNRSLVANFSVDPNAPKIAISEINYNSPSDTLQTGDWVEFHNYGTASVDLSGWSFMDDNDFNSFIFPQGTILASGAYLVLSNDLLKFSAAQPAVTNVIGDFTFKLSNSGERIRLRDNFGRNYLQITYDNKAPWSEVADGRGGTLELVSPTADLNNPMNWFGGCLGGSPGTAYVECPCEAPFLGPDKYLCETGGNVVLNTGLSEFSRTFVWFQNGEKMLDSTASITATDTGNYLVVMTSPYCVKEATVHIYDNVEVDLGADLDLCTPTSTNLYAGISTPITTFSWFRDNNDLGLSGASIKATVDGTYRVDVKRGSCTTVSSSVDITSSNPTPVDVIDCNGGNVTFSVQENGSYIWYDAPVGGSQVGTGRTVNKNISQTTTYYVEESNSFFGTVGPVDPDEFTGSQWRNDDWKQDYKLRFDVNEDLYLNAVWVDADGPQDIVVRVLRGPDENSLTVIQQKTVTITSGGFQRIALGMFIQAENNLWIDAVGTTGELIMNGNGGADWSGSPFLSEENGSQDGRIDVDGTFPTWGADIGWWFYFYNWEYGSSPEQCDRVPVTVYTCDAPQVNVTQSTSDIRAGDRVTFSAVVTGDYNSISWDFGIGASPQFLSGEGPHSVMFGDRGVHDIKVTISTNDGDYTTTQSQVTVCSSPDVITLTSDLEEYCGVDVQLSTDLLVGYEYGWTLNTGSLGGPQVDQNQRLGSSAGTYQVIVSDPINTNMCNTVSNELFINTCVLGTTDAEVKVGMYPNPAQDYVFVTGVNGSAEVHSISGKLMSQVADVKLGIDISDLESGIYMVTVTSESGEHILRLIKD